MVKLTYQQFVEKTKPGYEAGYRGSGRFDSNPEKDYSMARQAVAGYSKVPVHKRPRDFNNRKIRAMHYVANHPHRDKATNDPRDRK